MVDSRNITNLEKFTKIVYSKLKGQNVFLETSEAELLRWAGLCAANFQLGTVSAIKPWLNRIKEIKCLTKLHHAECLKQFKEFDYKAKNVYEKYVQKTKIQINQSRFGKISKIFILTTRSTLDTSVLQLCLWWLNPR